MNWGNLDDHHRGIMNNEIFNEEVYHNEFCVEAGDIVVDIGASAGPYANSILKYNPSIIYCIEPVKAALDLCRENTKGFNVKYLNFAIGNRETDQFILFDEEFQQNQLDAQKSHSSWS